MEVEARTMGWKFKMFLVQGGFDRGGGNIYHARLMFARPSIDSLEFARLGKTLSGEVAVGELPRLADLLFSDIGSVRYSIRGSQVGDRAYLLLELSGSCHLRCQRCLNDLPYPVEISSRLQLLEDLEDADLVLDDTTDESDGIEASREQDVLDLVEDELLLSLPFAPKHEAGVCELATGSAGQADGRFDMLARLKHK